LDNAGVEFRLSEGRQVAHLLNLLEPLWCLELRDGILEEIGVGSKSRILGDTIVVLVWCVSTQFIRNNSRSCLVETPENTHLSSQQAASKGTPHGSLDTVLLIDGQIFQFRPFAMEQVMLRLLRNRSN